MYSKPCSGCAVIKNVSFSTHNTCIIEGFRALYYLLRNKL